MWSCDKTIYLFFLKDLFWKFQPAYSCYQKRFKNCKNFGEVLEKEKTVAG